MYNKKFATKLVAFTLALGMCITNVPVIPGANEDSATNTIVYAADSDFTYDLNTQQITKYSGTATDVSIPATLGGPVSGIAPCTFEKKTKITSVTLADGITSVDWGCFSGCTSMSTITLSKNLNYIGSMAFEKCSSLTSVSIPGSVKVITPYAFFNCAELTSVVIAEGTTTLQLEAFGQCPKLSSIVLPDSIRTIEADVFEGCSSNLKIIASEDSYAASYAKEAGITFQEYVDESVTAVIAAIDAIGTVTLDSADAITAARTAYNALSDKQKESVSNYSTLTAAETRLAELEEEKRQEDASNAAIQAVIQAIDNIGTVTLDSEAAITAARTAYNRLTAAQQASVTNYATLVAAEAALENLKNPSTDNDDDQNQAAAQSVIDEINSIGEVTLDSKNLITTARSHYDALTAVQKALVTNYQTLVEAESALAILIENSNKEEEDAANLAAATAVINEINAIGEVTLASEAAITSARSKYNALTSVQKALVTNYDVLLAAEATLDRLKNPTDEDSSNQDQEAATAVINEIAAIGTVTLASESAIVAARAHYEALTSAQKLLVTNYNVLVAAETALSALKNNSGSGSGNENEENPDNPSGGNSGSGNEEEPDNPSGGNTDTIPAAVKVVINAIDAIGTVTLNSEAAIVSARIAYDKLTDAHKAMVTNYPTLTAAESALALLKTPATSVPQLKLNVSTATIYTAGVKTVSLSATVNGKAVSANQLTWSSQSTKIATVTNGVVTAKRSGTTVITARYGSAQATVTVKVKKPTLKLKKSKATIKVGKKYKIRATATPAKKITYKSSRKKIATVTSKGVIKGRRAGKATIRVKANGVTKKFTIRVK